MTRKTARENAFILIFEKSFREESLDEILEIAEEGGELEVDEFCKQLFFGVWENLENIDKLISENISGWKIGRLSSVALAASRLALFEMLYMEDIPVGVSINEAVELCKKFGTDKDASYVNGTLGAISRLEKSEE
ncbi:MAG: transcription antitermination factor NusB [Clostridia bacterium]|nr:transcription antitermination factor NusB [Clostridia bacterium]